MHIDIIITPLLLTPSTIFTHSPPLFSSQQKSCLSLVSFFYTKRKTFSIYFSFFSFSFVPEHSKCFFLSVGILVRLSVVFTDVEVCLSWVGKRAITTTST